MNKHAAAGPAPHRHTGLSHQEAEKRLAESGANELGIARRTPAIVMFFAQFKDFITLVLVVATAISIVIGEVADAITIIIIITLNAILGFIQEYRTEKSLLALKALSAPQARVIRGGAEVMIPAREVVPGDLLVLETGSRIAADGVLIEASNVQVNESILTGESVPVEKTCTRTLPGDMAHAAKDTAVYMGTTVSSGRGKAQVLSTGMNTEMGKIAHLLQHAEADETPLKKRLKKIGRTLVYICLACCVLIAVAGLIHGETLYNMFFSAISLAVAAIPESLPTIVTVSLAIGVQRMLKRNALVRKLPAVETLGSVTVICSDKTGTLTENRMSVQKVLAGGRVMDVSGEGSFLRGAFMADGKPVKGDAPLDMLLTVGALCNNSVYRDGSIQGDPTENAILAASMKGGMQQKAALAYCRVAELPFDADRKRMSVICTDSRGQHYLFVKGAPDGVLALCTHTLSCNGEQPLDLASRALALRANDAFSGGALRVLAFAYRKLSVIPQSPNAGSLEKDLVFAGLEGMIDPPRPEAVAAVKSCYRAGIRPVMITGDHKNTAVAVARELGLGNTAAITGDELEKLGERELETCANVYSIFARVSPKHKLRIVQALKQKGHIVAMTGDGVNDAPALKEADIGVAMGKCGTDVAREASSMVLLDDNFATIVAAVEEGRMIYDNIRKSLRYLLACNLGEILIMGLAALFGMPVPLIPIQILWINLVTDGLPALALGLDPPDPDIMRRRPRKTNDNVFSGGLGSQIFLSGLLIGGASIVAFCAALLIGGSLAAARTVCFATIITAELLYAFECRSEHLSAFKAGLFKNKWLVLSVLASFALMFLVMYMPFLCDLFEMVPLTLQQWFIVSSFATLEFSISTGIFMLSARRRQRI